MTAHTPTGPPTEYARTASTTPTRARERVSYDREAVHAILDAAFLCHLGFVADGRPVVLPTLYARDGERLYLHGSTGARALRQDALPVCLTVTHLDGLVLAKSAFHHSINYRSVVVHGTARRVTDEARARSALDAVIDAVAAGRSADCRPADARELAATAVLELELAEVSAKVRAGGPNDEPGDLGLPHWSGVVPLRTVAGPPEPADDGALPVELPAYLRELAG
ncbi:Nitroimidazol reductase NimA, pyridoxamine 5'-phosphate oxidase superfamily [Streptomyces zhaozhouensis]|uniref:Nitroimidazol reductase NimA, pyridoxamine 5'-phosphate oxidase superfamily n=1 Tax=Streptomyces zhaozhouensis TaxID=1300267 RepID=A0A286DZF2_9ACTN|nr:pyridoxamine 5'-phosphate oxidase family protein [Streptomyces zhaozhouensis]SOD64048.1 Nitroimidazol reductase NimA, pyridoxamine 5'-phosphate oxidase superfamily [Streptomyces zhaozhouensis]